MFCHFIFIILCLSVAKSSVEGESCIQEGVHGICINIKNCPAAIQDVRDKKKPQICSYDGLDPIVCCAGTYLPTTSTRPVATPQPVPGQSPTGYVDEIEDSDECKPLSPYFTSAKNGQKAWDKCIEYQEKIVFPCEKSSALTKGITRHNYCPHTADELIVRGPEAEKGDFPHTVLLGFGDVSDSAQWLCGGTLLSEWFILTAGHCTSTRDYGPVTYAILGISKRSDYLNSNVYKIKKIIRHPEYKPPSQYNDIALLQTEIQMSLGPYAVPACLDVGKEPKYDRAIETWWETLAYRGNSTETLLQSPLAKFTDHECTEKIPKTRQMKRGFDTTTQICYGDRSSAKSSCHNNSGGSLQVKNKHMYCMYTIVGVTSYGTACGSPDRPGIYTKVEPFVPWIESIVWV